MHRFGVFVAAVCGALIIAASASAHAELSPAVALTKHGQLFTLAVPTEKEATTTKVELTPPDGFTIDSFVPSPGWTRNVQSTGSGEETKIERVTWSGGHIPTEEDAVFQFNATPTASKTYTFQVRQTYDDESVVDWSGNEGSDTPAPTIEAKASLGGDGSSTVAIVALIAATLGILLALLAILGTGGDRPIT